MCPLFAKLTCPHLVYINTLTDSASLVVWSASTPSRAAPVSLPAAVTAGAWQAELPPPAPPASWPLPPCERALLCVGVLLLRISQASLKVWNKHCEWLKRCKSF